MAEQNPRTFAAAARRQWVFGVVVVATAVCVGTGALGHARQAGYLLAGVLGLVALLRLVVAPERLGGLVVRSRAVDVAFVAVLGIALAVLAATTPNLD